jgi:hypothetical protein
LSWADLSKRFSGGEKRIEANPLELGDLTEGKFVGSYLQFLERQLPVDVLFLAEAALLPSFYSLFLLS